MGAYECSINKYYFKLHTYKLKCSIHKIKYLDILSNIIYRKAIYQFSLYL